MIKEIGTSVILTFFAGMAAGETVISSELFEDRSGYPCFATLSTDAEKGVTIRLSDYKDVWSLVFLISDRASVYVHFFKSNGLRDVDRFEDTFDRVLIGDRSFDFNEASLFEVQRQDVDENTTGLFSVDEKHNVARALGAMAEDRIEIEGLISLDGTAEALSDFRSCSYTALGIQEGERVETDFRSEYRMIFEPAFENWVAAMARAESCLAARYDDDAVSEVVIAAADAFYPGITNSGRRGEYRADLEGMLPLARLSGSTEALTEGCLMAGRLADISRIPVDRTIREAEKLD